MNDVSASYLWGQLEKSNKINNNRFNSWNTYYDSLKGNSLLDLPTIPNDCIHNAHMFYIKVKNIKIRDNLLLYLKENNISAAFHYIPLHSSIAGLKFGRFEGDDVYTTRESERLIRLPLYYGINDKDIIKVIKMLESYIFDTKENWHING